MNDPDPNRERPTTKPPAWLDDDDARSWAELPKLDVSDQVSGSMTFTMPKMPFLTPPPDDAVANLPTPAPTPTVVKDDFPGLARLSRSRQGLPPAHFRVPNSYDESPNGTIASPEPSVGPVTYGMVLRNGTTEAIHEVRIEHELPTGPRLLAFDPPAHVEDARRLTWDVGTLEPGDRRRFKITVQPNRPDELPADASALFKVFQCLHSRTRVRRPKITASLIVSEEVESGDTIALGVEAINAGGGSADDVRILIALPPGFADGDETNLKFQRPTLGPGERCRFDANVLAARPGEYELQVYVVANGRVQTTAKAMVHIAGEEVVAESPPAAVDADDAFLVFVAADAWYALPVTAIAEVRRAADGPAGVIRVGGKSAPVIDLGALMGRAATAPERIIITRDGTALAVDRTIGVRSLPSRRAGGPSPHAIATADLDGHPVIVLDTEALPRPPRA